MRKYEKWIKFKRWYNKYLYFTILFPGLIIISIDWKTNFFELFFSLNGAFSNLVNISATFIGFLLTVVTIFFTVPKDGKFMQRLIETGHHRIFVKIALFGMVFFFLVIFLWLFGGEIPIRLATYSFICGSLEICASFYYVYHLIVKNLDDLRR